MGEGYVELMWRVVAPATADSPPYLKAGFEDYQDAEQYAKSMGGFIVCIRHHVVATYEELQQMGDTSNA